LKLDPIHFPEPPPIEAASPHSRLTSGTLHDGKSTDVQLLMPTPTSAEANGCEEAGAEKLHAEFREGSARQLAVLP